jgi:metal-responsive CopG/Arc/MetJ family transcriptional regulator
MPPKTKGKQVNIYFPEGLYDEMAKVMEKANAWMNVQEFVRDAVKEKVDRYYKEHAVG